MYDRREKKKIQRKWCKLVEHYATQPMDTTSLPRKLTVYCEAPPGDGLMSARDHFHEYVKPVLVSAALDWDAVEGRREGDIRAGLAEKIRKLRKLKGEPSEVPVEEDAETAVLSSRVRSGIKPANVVAGDIVIGRHTWKEYIRGLHEGWLGPIDPPPTVLAEEVAKVIVTPDAPASPAPAADDASPTASSTPTSEEQKPAEEKPTEEPEKPKKKKQPPPFNRTSDYSSSSTPPTFPNQLSPSAVVQFPHILGFLNTPIRMYRFLNRRSLADDVGRQTAAAVIAHYRPYHSTGFSADAGELDNGKSELESVLTHEEKSWHKSVRDRSKDEEGKERVWLDDMVLDPRISERMNRFELSASDEDHANEIAKQHPWWWREAWDSLTGKVEKDD